MTTMTMSYGLLDSYRYYYLLAPVSIDIFIILPTAASRRL
jgi:hypothetical protein